MSGNKIVMAAACVIAFAVGFVFAASPISPVQPRRDRPVLRFLTTTARYGLWFLWLTEPAPRSREHSQLVHHAPVGEDGFQTLDHGGSF
jgi:hypothetical protein